MSYSREELWRLAMDNAATAAIHAFADPRRRAMAVSARRSAPHATHSGGSYNNSGDYYTHFRLGVSALDGTDKLA